MNAWRDLIERYHEGDGEGDLNTLVMGPPAPLDAIEELEHTLKIRFPDEFRELYLNCNGFGETRDDGVKWLMMPLADIPAFTEQVRSWFQETHANVAQRFVAFFDWDTGDATGYSYTTTREIVECLITFEHEMYESDEGQDCTEFLCPDYPSIREFLAVD